MRRKTRQDTSKITTKNNHIAKNRKNCNKEKQNSERQNQERQNYKDAKQQHKGTAKRHQTSKNKGLQRYTKQKEEGVEMGGGGLDVTQQPSVT